MAHFQNFFHVLTIFSFFFYLLLNVVGPKGPTETEYALYILGQNGVSRSNLQTRIPTDMKYPHFWRSSPVYPT